MLTLTLVLTVILCDINELNINTQTGNLLTNRYTTIELLMSANVYWGNFETIVLQPGRLLDEKRHSEYFTLLLEKPYTSLLFCFGLVFCLQNSIRHNLSLHSRFVRVQNEGTGKSSWWMLNPEGGKSGKSPRRRAASMDNNSKFTKSRGRAAKKKVGPRSSANAHANANKGPKNHWEVRR